MGIVPEGRQWVIGAALAAAAAGGAAWLWPSAWLGIGAATAGLAFFLLVFFFRDPERTVPTAPGAIVAAADGHVVAIDSLPGDEYIGTAATRVSIFLSIFDAHVNRAPAAGVVEFTRYQPGCFLPAFQAGASARNEQMAIGIRTGQWRIGVRQIAGLVARRIVCLLQPGDRVERGGRFGMILFGSRTDMLLPAAARVLVRRGQRVLAGETVIGVLRD